MAGGVVIAISSALISTVIGHIWHDWVNFLLSSDWTKKTFQRHFEKPETNDADLRVLSYSFVQAVSRGTGYFFYTMIEVFIISLTYFACAERQYVSDRNQYVEYVIQFDDLFGKILHVSPRIYSALDALVLDDRFLRFHFATVCLLIFAGSIVYTSYVLVREKYKTDRIVESISDRVNICSAGFKAKLCFYSFSSLWVVFAGALFGDDFSVKFLIGGPSMFQDWSTLENSIYWYLVAIICAATYFVFFLAILISHCRLIILKYTKQRHGNSI